MSDQFVKGCLLPITACEISDASADQADIYRSIRDLIIRAHCAHQASASEDHVCSGKITIAARHVTLQCPKCGDERLLI